MHFLCIRNMDRLTLGTRTGGGYNLTGLTVLTSPGNEFNGKVARPYLRYLSFTKGFSFACGESEVMWIEPKTEGGGGTHGRRLRGLQVGPTDPLTSGAVLF